MNRFVRKLSLFADLTGSEITALNQATSRPRNVRAKHDLIPEGDEPGPVFVVLEGWAYRYKIVPSGSRQIMAFLMPGDCCDLHVGMLLEMDHGIQTAAPILICAIQRTEMDRLMDEHRGIARAMYVAQLADEGTLRAWIVSMGRRTTLERVAHLICELYLRARGVGLVVGSELALPLSQIVLADALGMTPVHINRVLKELRLSGAMALSRGQVTVLDPGALIQIAGFDENYLHRRTRMAA